MVPRRRWGSFWLPSDLDIIITGWNTNLVKKEDEPKAFDDFADPQWKNRLIAEPRDVDLLIGLAKYKFKSDERAIALMKKIAANNPEFHKGHSQLAELLIGGQAAACLTCYSHHFPGRIKKGAPLNYMLTEGVASMGATAVFRNAPHPNTATAQRAAEQPPVLTAFSINGGADTVSISEPSITSPSRSARLSCSRGCARTSC